MRNYIILLAILTLTFSCKDKDTNNTIVDKVKPEKEVFETTIENVKNTNGNYQIIFNGVFEKDDLMLLYYTEKPGEVLSSEKFKTVNITGNSERQDIVFNFDNGTRPYDLRLDFSDNKLQNRVKLNHIIFVDQYNKIVINKENIGTYFDFNNEMTFDKSNSLLIGTVFQIDGKDAYNPYFVANKSFIEVLQNMNENSQNKNTRSTIYDEFNILPDDENEHIILRGIFKSDDLVEIYYTEDSLEEFSPEKMMSITVKGSEKEQTLTFSLPEKTYVTKIRLDISDNKIQQGISINSLQFLIGEYQLKVKKSNWSEYFIANNYIIIDKNTGEFSCKFIEENGLKNYNPYFVSSVKLIEKLQLL